MSSDYCRHGTNIMVYCTECRVEQATESVVRAARDLSKAVDFLRRVQEWAAEGYPDRGDPPTADL